MPTEIMPLVRPMPKAPVTPMASTMAGKDSKVSTTRLIASSSQPPTKPAIRPTGMPIRQAMLTARKLAYSVAGAPWISRLSTSRPRSSVPSQWSPLGGSSMLLTFCAVGECGAITVANTATPTRNSRKPRLRQARRSRRSQRATPSTLRPQPADCEWVDDIAYSLPTRGSSIVYSRSTSRFVTTTSTTIVSTTPCTTGKSLATAP